MPFSSLRFSQFCDFRPKVCFSASEFKRFEIFSSSSNSVHFFLLIQGIFAFFVNLKGNSVFFSGIRSFYIK
ncbi:hypothetical protein Hanom_Chr06g00506771 [Helianthus anomalus]